MISEQFKESVQKQLESSDLAALRGLLQDRVREGKLTGTESIEIYSCALDAVCYAVISSAMDSHIVQAVASSWRSP